MLRTVWFSRHCLFSMSKSIWNKRGRTEGQYGIDMVMNYVRTKQRHNTILYIEVGERCNKISLILKRLNVLRFLTSLSKKNNNKNKNI